MKQKLLEMVPVTVLFHTDEFIFVWSFKNGNGCQNRSSGAKTGLLRRAGAKSYFPGDTRNVGVRRGLSYGIKEEWETLERKRKVRIILN